MRNTAYVRYAIALVALMLGFALTIRLGGDRGVLFESPGAGALASPATTPDGYDLQALSILNRVLLQLADNYVEPERIDPHKMLVYALDRVQNSVPEVVTLFDADVDAEPVNVEVRVGAATASFSIDGIESRWEMWLKLREIFRFLQQHINPDETDLQEVEYAAINGLLATLDPHSVLLTPAIYEDMQASNRGSFGGLGIVISIRDGQLTVISPIANTPASRAGFEAGDRIVKIGDESTVNMPLDEAVSRLRGAPGTSITVEIMRDGWTEPHAFSLEREIISIESVTHEALGDGVGYVSIQNFQANTHDDLLAALDALDEELGGLEGVILDLRNNPGGLLQQAIAVTDTFLDRGTIVTTVGVGDRLREENVAGEDATVGRYPIVVLVNPGSASASEIVAGALKSHDRALVVGERTFGKGSVQVLYEFEDGSALKLTIAKYLTPGDVSIQGVGIVPDVQIQPMLVTDERVDLYASLDIVREGDLATSLAGDPGALDGVELPSAVLKFFDEPVESEVGANVGADTFEMDFEIAFAQRVLEAAEGVVDRTALLALANDAIEDVGAEQLVAVQEQLRTRNVDWARGDNVIQPVSLEASLSNGEGRVQSGESIELTLSLTNDGSRALHQVRAVSDSDYAIFHDLEFLFGRLEPGQSAEWTVTVDVPVEDPTRYERIRFMAFADTIDLATSADAYVTVMGQARPHWGFSYVLDDREGGNGDGLLQVGETVNFVMDVTNIGDGEAGETIMYLRNQSDSAIFLREGRTSIDHLGPGQRHRAVFSFDVQSRPEDGEVILDADVYDSVFREFLNEQLSLPVGVADGAPTYVAQTGHVVASSGPLAIYAGAAVETPQLARAAEQALLEVVGGIPGWFHVTWGTGDERGWVSGDDVTYAEEVQATAGEVTELVHFQAPVIQLSEDVLQTASDTFTLEGSISDDRAVRDFYVAVLNFPSPERPHSTKYAYQYLGVPSATIQEEIPLRPGMNRITVVARDDDKITSSQVVFVYRTP